MKKNKSKKNMSFYKKSLLLFTLLLACISLVFLIYVHRNLVIYERNLADNYIKYLATSGKITNDLNDDMFVISKYEKNNAKITDGLKNLFKSKDLNIKKNTKLSNDKIYAYDLKIGDKLVSTVSLKSKKNYTKMAILTITEWEVEDIKTYFDKGIYNISITIPEAYKAFVNNIEVTDFESGSGDSKELERLTKYVNIDKSKNVKIDNLVFEPKVKIVDEKGSDVAFENKNGEIIFKKEYKQISSYEEASKYIKDDFNILELAKNYSLFLTDDLKGASHGLDKLTPYLIRDSYMYNMAYNWAHNVDITFVSRHTLKNPTFTNETIKDCIIYSEDAFSCVVHLEKNMIVNGQDRVDTMNDRLFFVYYENGYKLVDMKAVKE